MPLSPARRSHLRARKGLSGGSNGFIGRVRRTPAPGDLMGVQITHVPGGLVAAVQDVSQLDLVSRLVGRLEPSPPAAVVVDVSDLTMAPSGGVDQLVGRLRAAAAESRWHRWSLVAARLTARRILRQLCADTTIGVFPSVEAALAAVPPGLAPNTGTPS